MKQGSQKVLRKTLGRISECLSELPWRRVGRKRMPRRKTRFSFRTHASRYMWRPRFVLRPRLRRAKPPRAPDRPQVRDCGAQTALTRQVDRRLASSRACFASTLHVARVRSSRAMCNRPRVRFRAFSLRSQRYAACKSAGQCLYSKITTCRNFRRRWVVSTGGGFAGFKCLRNRFSVRQREKGWVWMHCAP